MPNRPNPQNWSRNRGGFRTAAFSFVWGAAGTGCLHGERTDTKCKNMLKFVRNVWPRDRDHRPILHFRVPFVIRGLAKDNLSTKF